jgi:hypothetical protein
MLCFVKKYGSSIAIAFSCLFGLSGCASYKGGAVQHRDASQFGNFQKSEGVEIGAEALTNETKVKEVFYVNVTEEGFYPVEISILNSSSSRFLLEKDRIELVATSGTLMRPVSVISMTNEFEKNKMAYALLGFGIFSYMSADEANKKMASDWTSKELSRETIVNPGRRTSGFVYFRLPKGQKPTGMELVLPVENLEAKVTQTLRLPL